MLSELICRALRCILLWRWDIWSTKQLKNENSFHASTITHEKKTGKNFLLLSGYWVRGFSNRNIFYRQSGMREMYLCVVNTCTYTLFIPTLNQPVSIIKWQFSDWRWNCFISLPKMVVGDWDPRWGVNSMVQCVEINKQWVHLLHQNC